MRLIPELNPTPPAGRPTRAGWRPRTADRKRRSATRLTLEPLEDRTLLSLLPAVNYAVGEGPQSVAMVDFNGDGKLDLVTANHLGGANGNVYGTVSVLLGNGDGTFQAAQNSLAPGANGALPVSVAVGDFNGDGKLDLGVTSDYVFGDYSGGGSEGYASVLLGDGQGGFSTPTLISLGAGYFTSAVVADFNGDGMPDFAAAEYQVNQTYGPMVDGTTISVLLNDGLGNLQAPTSFSAGSAPTALAAGDVNGDGHIDLMAANRNSNTVSVMLGNGGGAFASPTSYATGGSPTAIVLGDFNNDGRPDIATANASAGASVLLGNGNGSFQNPLNYATPSAAAAVAAGDLNGDGFRDLAVANGSSSGNVSVLLNDTNWPVNLAQATSFAVSGVPSPTTAGVAHSFTVTAETAGSTTATGYTATVHFSSSDIQAGLPANYTFTAADHGMHTFTATLKTAGTQSISVDDTATPGITGTQAGITVNPAAASRFLLTAPTSVKAGVSFSLTVTVEDAYGNIVTGYVGTLHFTSTDGSATLPADYTFTAADSSVHIFTGLVLRKRSKRTTITVTDTLNSSLTGSVTETVT